MSDCNEANIENYGKTRLFDGNGGWPYGSLFLLECQSRLQVIVNSKGSYRMHRLKKDFISKVIDTILYYFY